MKQMKAVKKELGDRYQFQKFISEKEIRSLMSNSYSNFIDTVAAVLTAGCVKIELIIFKTYDSLALGFDVFVKDTPESSEWICYDSLSDPVCFNNRNLESVMFTALNRVVENTGLSFTGCNFRVIEGKKILDISKPL